jgi:hypothetical protein
MPTVRNKKRVVYSIGNASESLKKIIVLADKE